MNIFVLDKDPQLAAKYHCDKHLIKMITEHNQILGSIAHVTRGAQKKSDITPNYKIKNFKGFPRVDENQEPHPYGIGYKNHPCTVWAMESSGNYEWLCELNLAMCKEYSSRYGKTNVGESITEWYKNNPPKFEKKEMTPFALAMPEDLKSKDAVHSYRLYYAAYKAYFTKWKNGVPDWWKKYLKIAVEKDLVHERSLPNVKLFLEQ